MQRDERREAARRRRGKTRLTGYVAAILLVPLPLGTVSFRFIPYYTDPPLSGGG